MTAKVYIQNLKCHGCANTIRTQLERLVGISNVGVSNDDDSVSFDYVENLHIEAAKAKLSSLGYPSTDEANSLPKKAKSFVSCAVGRISK